MKNEIERGDITEFSPKKDFTCGDVIAGDQMLWDFDGV